MKPAHRPSQRDAALDAALDLLRDGGSLSLESAARAAGMSKPGLMYHFSTKEALVAALVDHLIDDYERTFVALLPAGGTDPSARERIAAYLEWSVTHDARRGRPGHAQRPQAAGGDGRPLGRAVPPLARGPGRPPRSANAPACTPYD